MWDQRFMPWNGSEATSMSAAPSSTRRQPAKLSGSFFGGALGGRHNVRNQRGGSPRRCSNGLRRRRPPGLSPPPPRVDSVRAREKPDSRPPKPSSHRWQAQKERGRRAPFRTGGTARDRASRHSTATRSAASRATWRRRRAGSPRRQAGGSGGTSTARWSISAFAFG